MKRQMVLAAAGVAIVAAGLSGCSGDKSTTESGSSTEASHGSHTSTSTSTSVSASASESAGATQAKVSIDGKDQNIAGTVACVTAAGQVNIAIGEAATGVAVVLTDASPPGVTSVALGNVNGITLGYTQGTGEGDASATKDGNSYKITGTATGVDMKNPMDVVKKPFEIDVTCP